MKKIIKERKGTNFSLYLEGDQMERLEDLKWRERKSISELVRDAINEYLSSHMEGNKTFSLEKWQEDPNFKALPTLLSPLEIWSIYIDQCNDDELTRIAIANTNVKKLVNDRRTREFKEQKVRTNSLGRI